MTLETMENIIITNYTHIIKRGKAIYGLPTMYVEKAEFDIDTYKIERAKDIAGPQHKYSSLAGATEEYY